MIDEPADGYGGLSAPEDLHHLGTILADVFGFPAPDAAGWFANIVHQNIRAMREAGQIVGGLLLIHMGQYFGGRSVKLGGVAGVGTSAIARGKGSATRMMQDCLREFRQSGYPLAGLYPATQPLYRRVGFEQAGARFEISVDLRNLPTFDRALPVRAFRNQDADVDAIEALYAEVARTRNGWLDRGRYVWNRVQNLRGMVTQGYLVGEPDALEGYVFFGKVRNPSMRFDMKISDLVYRTPRAAERLLTLLADHASMGQRVSWFGSAEDPLLLRLREQDMTVTVQDSNYWMLRLLDVPGALEARGWPQRLKGELDLEIDDPLFPENTGRFRLQVEGGRAKVSRGGTGALRCEIRVLAPLYSGHRSASDLARVGLLSGSAETLNAADELFAARSPSMPDMY